MDVIDAGNVNCEHMWMYHLHGNYQMCTKCGRIERYELRQS